MKFIKFFIFAFLFFTLFSCADSREQITQEKVVLPFLKKQPIDKHLTTITSQEELESVITLNYEEIYSKIPSNELLAFIESVEYNERGITTFRYDYLQNNFSEENLLKVFKNLFIVDDSTTILRIGSQPYDLNLDDNNGGSVACPFIDYQCMKQGTCAKARSYICTCNC